MVMSRIASAFTPNGLRTAPAQPPQWQDDPVALYKLLRAYYDSVDLYDTWQRLELSRDTWAPAMRGVRNPCHRVVEFYAATLDLGGGEIITENERIKEPIEQVWKWSNWAAKNRLASRWFSRDGDLFIKVVSRREEATADGRIYFQLIDAAHVTTFDKDERGFITYIRIDVPRVRRDREGEEEEYLHTEIWDKDLGTYRRWERDMHRAHEKLGTPIETLTLASFGIDFIPIVHALFKDVGNLRGQNAYLHALDKIDEANRQATRLHQMLFKHNNVTWALSANAQDASGRPLPPPRIEGGSNNGSGDPSMVHLGDETMLRLPGMASLEALVPDINYEHALAVLNAQLDELERDLPELAFHRLRSLGNISGRAARMMMTDAIDKVIEARMNGEQALARADEMALSMGQAMSLPEFADIGDYDAGDFEHQFEPRDPIGITEDEKWQTEQTKHEAMKEAIESGVSVNQTLRERGYSDEEIAEMATERDGEQGGAFERALRDFDRGTA